MRIYNFEGMKSALFVNFNLTKKPRMNVLDSIKLESRLYSPKNAFSPSSRLKKKKNLPRFLNKY